MLFSTPKLDERATAVIARIERLKDQLGYLVNSTPKRWTGLLRRNALARAVRGSNSIEGYDVSVDDAVAAAEGEEPLDAKTEAWLAVTGYQDAMSYVLQLANDPHFRYSPDLIRGLHYMMVKHDLSKNPGRWRPGQIFVHDDDQGRIVYEGPSAEMVPGLIDQLVTQLPDETAGPPMVRAAMAHLNFVMIHPFSDGNGRMARCLQTLVLARHGTLSPQLSSIEEYLGANVQPYYAILAEVGAGAWHPERDARPWVEFCLKAHFIQATTMLQRAQMMDRIWVTAEAEVKKFKLPERTVIAIADAIYGLRVRNATYRRFEEVSEQVASKDFKRLVDLGLLVPHGERRGRYYVGADRLKALRVTPSDKQPIADPFANSSPNQLTLAMSD